MLLQVQLTKLLRWHINWLRQDMHSLRTESTMWIFALLALLEKPISASTAAHLRIMLRHLQALKCQQGHGDGSMKARMQLLVAIAGAYFGQDERFIRFSAHTLC